MALFRGGWAWGDRLPEYYGRLEPTNLTWNHLWYVAYLYCYSLIFGLVYYLTKPILGWRLALNSRKALGVLLLAPALYLWFVGQSLWHKYPPNLGFVNDWFNHARYFGALIWGFIYVQNPALRTTLVTVRAYLLVCACVSYIGILYFFRGFHIPAFGIITLPQAMEGLVWSANSWLWLLTLLAWAEYCLNRPWRIMMYFNGGIYCYYIVHQTWILIFLSMLKPLQLAGAWEPLLLTVTTLLACGLSYALVRKIPQVNHCFGCFR